MLREDLHLLYTVSTTDIGGFKQQQWSVTNSALLLQAALVGVSQALKPHFAVYEACLLVALSSLLAVAAIVVVATLEMSIRARRERLRRVRAELGSSFQQLWQVCKPPDTVQWLLYGVLAVAWAVVLLILLRQL